MAPIPQAAPNRAL